MSRVAQGLTQLSKSWRRAPYVFFASSIFSSANASSTHPPNLSQTPLASSSHSALFSIQHSSQTPFSSHLIRAILRNVSTGRHNPLSANAGPITRSIHVSANTSVHAMCPAVATVNRMGVKCEMRRVCSVLQVVVVCEEREECGVALSPSKCEVVATV